MKNQISPKRVRTALSYAQKMDKGDEKLRSNIGRILKSKGTMRSLANRLVHG